MGFLDKLFRRGQARPEKPPSPPRLRPTRSIINDPDLKVLADLSRYYPLPAGFKYQERTQGDFVVSRKSDGREYVFLAEEGILSWDDPFTREDGSIGYKTTEVLKRGGVGPHPGQERHQFGFPLGKNIISDPDIRIFADLDRYYPLPEGFEYQQTGDGVPVIVRAADSHTFSFLIEEGLLSFDEQYTKSDGRKGYRTTEVFKQA
jgi:hypothetical protein